MENNSEKNWVDQRLGSLTPPSDWQPDVPRGLARLRGKQGRRSARKLAWSAATLAAGLSIVSFPGPRAAAQRFCELCAAAAVQNFGSAAAQANLKPQRDRKPAPDFTLNDASGHPVQLYAFKGKVVLLDFWATWCGGCKVEIPWFIEFQQKYADRGLAVLGVSFDEDGWKTVKPYMDEKKINYRVMIGNNDIATRYGGLDALPVTLLIDRSGRIASTHVGLGGYNEFKAEIETLLNK